MRFKDYPSLIEEIRLRPQMWHGGKDRSVTLLSTYLSGFRTAEKYHQISPDECLSGFDWRDFESWVAEKFNPRRLSYDSFSWAAHISDSECEAFDLWYSWYDKYMYRSGSPS